MDEPIQYRMDQRVWIEYLDENHNKIEIHGQIIGLAPIGNPKFDGYILLLDKPMINPLKPTEAPMRAMTIMAPMVRSKLEVMK